MKNMIKNSIKFSFQVFLLVVLFILGDRFIPLESSEGITQPSTRTKTVYVKQKRKVYVVTKNTLVTTKCNNGHCNKRVQINKVTKSN